GRRSSGAPRSGSSCPGGPASRRIRSDTRSPLPSTPRSSTSGSSAARRTVPTSAASAPAERGPPPMSPAPDDDLRARLDALERRVAELERQARTVRPLRRATTVTKRAVGFRWAEARSEDVLGKAGIALLLVGVLFLLKYTLEQGWLTAAVRV